MRGLGGSTLRAKLNYISRLISGGAGGLVGYDARLTRGRSPVRIRAGPPFISLVNQDTSWVMRLQELCVLCKGYKRLCGKPVCPILERLRFAKLASLRVGRSYYGPTPPSALVGEYGYPRVPVGVNMVGEPSEKPEMYDSPGEWWGRLGIREIIRLRSSLIYSKTVYDVRKPRRLMEVLAEAAMSTRPVDLEVEYLRAPKPMVRFDGHLAPMGPSAPLKSALLASNPRIPRVVDRVVYDRDLKASQAVLELYEHGSSVYTITRLLSMGLLGLKFQRRLVPTRWAITAVDVMIGNELVKRLKKYPELSSIEVYSSKYIGNSYHILLVPGPYIFEVFEAWYPGGLWTGKLGSPYIIHNWEDSRGPQPGGINDGGYYAARLPILEFLKERRRKASIIVVREITPEYYAPVGSWQIRESVRNALRRHPKRFNSLSEALKFLETRLMIKLERILRWSKVLKYHIYQRKLTEYL